ncbi:hypothetical protein [Parafrigoribacterium soli]|uniref:hypothetical protein n=1 Tax=Parafrigoribacterium soli TaxID=3144663 RepID=UPI0032EF0C6F
MGLFAGALSEAIHSFQLPPGERIANLWWPADHAWFVVTEIDFDSTIVAGTRACIEAVLLCDALEAIQVRPEDNLGAK